MKRHETSIAIFKLSFPNGVKGRGPPDIVSELLTYSEPPRCADSGNSPNAYVQEGHPIITPAGCKNLHQEVELGVVIGKTAKSVPRSEAMSYVGGYTVALDMTARDFQDEAKKGGAPWFLAKSFDTACPVSKFIPKEEANSGRIHSLYYPLYARVTVLQNWREVLKDASPPSRF
ncbi:hypothetical protein Y032_0027g1522 [Ancylostoma ceylanicum]|uniref:oxaloacetate tautomerase n=1 Tax=Ancylostoma ceylanicum TaxID=53326 RepID=A0A016UVG1_9BILA|nr:hypothetical protein Y032_0027g1522 [Ancylostoma ceylanicum]